MHRRPNKEVVIQSGMTATAEIQTGKNTLLQFIARPLIKTASETFGERRSASGWKARSIGNKNS